MPARDDEQNFNALIESARATQIEGWDFSFLGNRVQQTPLPWDYRQIAVALVAKARRVLDVDTGGGELFSALAPPSGSVAIEDWPPNVPVAERRLEPMGITVVPRQHDRLPAGVAGVDLVLNRHGDLDLLDTARILTSGGVLLTQQVGFDNEREINQAFGTSPTEHAHVVRDLPTLIASAVDAGFTVQVAAEAVTMTRYLDVGALVMQLRAVPWQVPGFTIDSHLAVLRRIHHHIAATGSFDSYSRRLLLQAQLRYAQLTSPSASTMFY